MTSGTRVPSGSTARGLDAVRRQVGSGLVTTANRTGYAVGAYLGSVLVVSWAMSLLEGWSFADSLWWAFTTTTTTGYGDLYPVTGAGRVVAVVTMFLGIVAIGVIVGRIAAVVIRTHDDFTHEEQVDLLVESDEQIRLLQELHARMDVVEQALPTSATPHRRSNTVADV